MKNYLIIILLFTLNCSFLFREPGRPPKINGIKIPDKERKLYIQNFQNNSYGPGLHTVLTQYVKSEVDRKGRFLQVRRKEDATFRLYGKIIHYQKVGNLMDIRGNEMSSELFVIVQIEIQEVSTGQKIPLVRDEIPATIYYSDQLGYRETEDQAQARLLRMMAMRVTEECEDAWYYYIKSQKEPAK